MSSRRPLILMGAFLVLLLGFIYFTYLQPLFRDATPPSQMAPLAGKNTVSGVRVSQSPSGQWMVDFDYFFTGQPRVAEFTIDLVPQGFYTSYVPHPERGAHHTSAVIAYPGDASSTRQVVVTLRAAPGSKTVLAKNQADTMIHWPTRETWNRNERLAHSSPDENLNRAVALIDAGGEERLSEAKLILERLVGDNAQFDAAYVELARIAMRTNWGPDGLHQAESLLDSALQIRPDSVNAKILLGYVYAHQRRFAKAEPLFVEAARSSPPNLWLWANWGELLAMQGKTDQAIAKYREAVTRPMTHDTYDRARADAYLHLLALLERRKDFDGMEGLYKKRIEEFGPGSCYSAAYARFMLNVRDNAQGAIDLSRRALNQNCDDTESRQILGLAHYVLWARSSGPESTAALNQARLFLPAGPTALYQLAASDRTLPAVRKLVASGEAIDQKDSQRLTALAHALQHRDLAAATRLLALGARTDTPVSYGDIPVALLPVMDEDIEAIRVFQRAGVDYTKLRFRGATAIDFAKQSGNEKLLEALTQKGTAL